MPAKKETTTSVFDDGDEVVEISPLDEAVNETAAEDDDDEVIDVSGYADKYIEEIWPKGNYPGISTKAERTVSQSGNKMYHFMYRVKNENAARAKEKTVHDYIVDNEQNEHRIKASLAAMNREAANKPFSKKQMVELFEQRPVTVKLGDRPDTRQTAEAGARQQSVAAVFPREVDDLNPDEE